jgi:membrane-associated phospholipid phosphatase
MLVKVILTCVIVGTVACSTQLSAQGDNIENSGDYLSIGLPLVALASTVGWRDGQPATLDFAKSMVTSVWTTVVLKRAVDKTRPNGGQYSWPSGHTSSAFVGAGVLQIRHGWKVGVPAYLLAGYVGWTRVDAEAHYYVDVVSGAIIGIVSAYMFTSPFGQDRIALSLDRRDREYVIALSLQF